MMNITECTMRWVAQPFAFFAKAGAVEVSIHNFESVQGRWFSPDPAGMAAADPTNPQSWNRYAYVMNNPLANVDPLGLACDLVGSDVDGDISSICDGDSFEMFVSVNESQIDVLQKPWISL